MGRLRRSMRNLLPSMFHRRLLLLAVAMVVVLCVLGAAATLLTTGQSFRDARATAESKLQRQQLIQTKRGSIVDRNGLVLAEDDPGWELAVHFDLLTGKWARKQAYADASRDKLAWGEMGTRQREAAVEKMEREYSQQTEAMFEVMAEIAGVSREELAERRRDTLARVQRIQVSRWSAWKAKAEKERGEPVALDEVAQPLAEEFDHHVLIGSLDEDQRLLLETFIDEGRRGMASGEAQARSALPWTMVELRRATQRRYPLDRMTVELDRSTLPGPLAKDEPVTIEVAGVGLHLIGMMRDVWKEDEDARPLKDAYGRVKRLAGYDEALGDRIGRSGVEQAMERQLRGSRGLRTINLDSGKTTHEVAPAAGRDVMLTIDIKLQAHIQAIMSPELGLMQTLPWHLKPDDPRELLGTQLNGSAVVLDIASGDVLAAVSVPEAPRALLKEDPDLLWNDPINEPMLNRAVARPYQPGSTLKPLVLAAVVSEGLLGENELVHCKGYLWDNKPEVFRDWLWKSHKIARGDIDGVRAIEVSNNPFFGLMVKDKLIPHRGVDRLPDWYHAFGFSEKPGTGLPEEISGALGRGDAGYEHNEVCFMAIGQGPVSVTPMQSAVAYMRIASGDMNKRPRLIVSPPPPTMDDAPKPSPYRVTSTAQRMVFEGMRRSAGTNDGTTHHITDPGSGMNREPIFNVEGVEVMAKSGTADPGRYRHIDFNRNGKVDDGEVEANPRDHAWVVALVKPAGAPKPTHAIACVVEYAGSGGRVAGPIVNQIIHALQDHQYLDWPPTR